MKALIAIAALLLLTACDPTPEEINNVRHQLPTGCRVRDLGSYGDIHHLIVVQCYKNDASTASTVEKLGKTTNDRATISVD